MSSSTDALRDARARLAEMEEMSYREQFGPPGEPREWIVAARKAVEKELDGHE